MNMLRLFGTAILAFAMAGSSLAADRSASELYNSGRMDDAIRALTAAVEANQQDAQSVYMLSRAYYSLEDFDSAIKYGERAVALKPNDSLYQFWLGRAYGEKADRASALSAMSLAKKAASAFQRSLQLDPNNAATRRALAEFYVEAPSIMGGGRDKARGLAEQVAGSDPAVSAWIRALVANKEKNWTEAETQFKNAVKYSGNASWAWLELARFYAWGKRWNDFEAAVGNALTSDKKKPADLFNAAEMLVGTGRNFPEAVKALNAYLASPQKDDEYPAFRAHYLLGQLHEKSGDKTKAASEYREALALAQGFRPAQAALKRVGA